MSWFSTPKCPIHNIPYSIGKGMFEDFYYCRLCVKKAKSDRGLRDDVENLKKEIAKLKNTP